MREVHRRPIQYPCVSPYVPRRLREKVRYEQRLERSAAGVEGRECTEDDWRVGERGRVSVGVEQRVNACETTRRTFHGVIRWCQPMDQLVPRRGAREEDLGEDADEIHVAECTCPEVECWF